MLQNKIHLKNIQTVTEMPFWKYFILTIFQEIRLYVKSPSKLRSMCKNDVVQANKFASEFPIDYIYEQQQQQASKQYTQVYLRPDWSAVVK